MGCIDAAFQMLQSQVILQKGPRDSLLGTALLMSTLMST